MRVAIVAPLDSGWSIAFQGFANALNTKGQVAVFNERAKSSFDLFAEFNPTSLILRTEELSPHLVKCILKYRPNVYLKLSNYGSLADKLGLRPTKQEKELVNSIPITRCFCHYVTRAEDMVGGWNLPYISLPLAVDSIRYKPDKPFDVDCAYVGGYSIKKPKLDWLCKLSFDLKIRIFGYGDWPTPSYLGPCTQETENRVLSGVVPNFLEEEDFICGYNERPYKVAMCGGYSICQDNEANRVIFGDSITYFKTEEELREKILEKNKKKQTFPIEQHTYISRIEELFKS